jgi:hypothetical protein
VARAACGGAVVGDDHRSGGVIRPSEGESVQRLRRKGSAVLPWAGRSQRRAVCPCRVAAHPGKSPPVPRVRVGWPDARGAGGDLLS